MTLFELKEKMATLASAIQADAQWISEKAANPETTMDELNAKKTHRDELQSRYDMVKAEHDDMEARQKAAVQAKSAADGYTESEKKTAGKNAFYKAAILGGDVHAVTKDFVALGAIPQGSAELGRGENLLPTNMTTELIVEPTEDNSLRQVEQVTNITGLERPIIAFEIDETTLEFVTDKDTAREIEMQGGKISFGRFKAKIAAKISDTVIHGANTNLQSEVDNQLRSGLAMQEKIRAFNPNPTSEYAHMSFYSNGIKVVTGEKMYDAITSAYADLPEFFAQNAKCVMRRSDYISMIRDLANNSTTLFGKQPEEVLGMPVIFNSHAIIPVVGDFRYAQMNYENGVIYDADKDIKAGLYEFVITAWYDHRILLKSAFRLAALGVPPTISGATINGTPKVGESLGVDVTFSSGNPTPTLSYQWRIANSAGGTYTDISGAVMPSYTPVEGDIGKFIKVVVTAVGSATGNVTSGATTAIVAAG